MSLTPQERLDNHVHVTILPTTYTLPTKSVSLESQRLLSILDIKRANTIFYPLQFFYSSVRSTDVC